MSFSNELFGRFYYRLYGTFLYKDGSIISTVDLPTTEIMELIYVSHRWLFLSSLILQIELIKVAFQIRFLSLQNIFKKFLVNPIHSF